jgi:hypothetical protein
MVIENNWEVRLVVGSDVAVEENDARLSSPVKSGVRGSFKFSLS